MFGQLLVLMHDFLPDSNGVAGGKLVTKFAVVSTNVEEFTDFITGGKITPPKNIIEKVITIIVTTHTQPRNIICSIASIVKICTAKEEEIDELINCE